jgi:hypothetical protein
VRRLAALPRAILLGAAVAILVAACSTGSSGNGGTSNGAPVIQPAPVGSPVAPGY